MKRRDLVQRLLKAGWVITDGNPHDKAKHPEKPGIKIPIPKHREIDKYTAQGILEAAGLE